MSTLCEGVASPCSISNGQAAAQVAHEIRNPLNSIRLGVLHLRDITPPEGEARAIIDIIERGIAHLNKLTVDVSQFAR